MLKLGLAECDRISQASDLAEASIEPNHNQVNKLFADCLTFFTTVDPVGTLTVFVGLTAAAAPEDRARIAWRAVALSFVILIFNA